VCVCVYVYVCVYVWWLDVVISVGGYICGRKSKWEKGREREKVEETKGESKREREMSSISSRAIVLGLWGGYD